MKASKFLFNLSSVICFIYGALYIFSLVFIPIGVYCFIAAKRFNYKADHLLDNFAVDKKVMRNYVAFVSIACFPLGLISIIPYFLTYSNNVSVTNAETTSDENNIQISDANEEKPDETEEQKPVEEVEAHTEINEEEKIEKFNKLKKFHEKGIITDDELEMAREQLFGKSENE